MKRYVFISNSSRPTPEVRASRDPVKITNFSRPCLKAALKMGYEVYLGVNRDNPEELECELPVKKYDSHTYRSITAFGDNKIAYNNISKLLKKHDFDVIHCNTPIGGMVGRFAGKKHKVPKVIYTVHGFHFYKGAPLFNRTVLKWAEKLMAHWTDAIITINKEDYEVAKKLKLRKGGKAYLVHGVGIDLKDYQNPAPTNQAKRDELGIPADAFVLISVGELNENKNNKVIISALAQLNRKDIHYVLCGIGDKEQALKEQAEAAGLSDNIHFLGFRKDVKQLYEMADCFVMSSYREGLPRSIMEGMASGLPCIVSDIRGNVDLVEAQVGGYLCKSDDYSDFANAISELAQNTEVREQMGAYNLEKIKEFDVSVVEKELLDIYEEVLNG